MKVTMKYDQGRKKEEIITLEVCEKELAVMVENDYQQRLARVEEGEVLERRTAEEIFEEMNRKERNSWQTHNRHQHQFPVTFESDGEDEMDLDLMDMFGDYSQMDMLDKKADYEVVCQWISQILSPKQAEMFIAIALDGMRVWDYADMIQDNPKRVSERYNYAKSVLKKAYSTSDDKWKKD